MSRDWRLYLDDMHEACEKIVRYLGDMDKAALRQFALKVRFDFLRVEQAQRLLETTHCALGVAHDEAARAAEALRLERLTPRDFAAVARRFRVLGETPQAEASRQAFTAA